MADQLASEESDRRLASRVQQNQLTSAEQAAVFKEYLREKNIKDLHEGKYKDNTNTKTRSGMQKWHIHKSRHITRVLFRLRTGHNRLKANLVRFNNKIDSTCSYCEEDETTKHILLKCPGLETEREKIRLYFTAHNIEINLRNLLGLNQKFNSNTQHEIQRLITKFLKKAKLINRI